MPRAIVIVNAHAGSLRGDPRRLTQIERLLRDAGIEAEILLRRKFGIEAAARDAVRRRPAMVVAAGGDGTISSIAAVLAGTGIPLGVLPLGTRNHFARDLGLPLGMEDAVRVLAEGAIHRIDLGEVNGRVFVNNSSIGFYPRLVRLREKIGHRSRPGKWVAAARAAMGVFRRFPNFRVVLQSPHGAIRRRSPLVFVGNNRYDLRLPVSRARERLDEGALSLYVANRTGRAGILRLTLDALLGDALRAPDLESAEVEELWIHNPRRRIAVAMDGEVLPLRTPLHFRIRPRALPVLVPGEGEAG